MEPARRETTALSRHLDEMLEQSPRSADTVGIGIQNFGVGTAKRFAASLAFWSAIDDCEPYMVSFRVVPLGGRSMMASPFEIGT